MLSSKSDHNMEGFSIQSSHDYSPNWLYLKVACINLLKNHEIMLKSRVKCTLFTVLFYYTACTLNVNSAIRTPQKSTLAASELGLRALFKVTHSPNAVHRDSAVMYFIFHTCAFLTVTCQNIFSEKGLLNEHKRLSLKCTFWVPPTERWGIFKHKLSHIQVILVWNEIRMWLYSVFCVNFRNQKLRRCFVYRSRI